MTTVIDDNGLGMTVTLESDCKCWRCPECHVISVGCEYGDKCDDCDNELVAADNCFGCWDESLEDFYEALEGWRREAGVEDWNLIRITGSDMGWDHRRGYTVAKFAEAHKALTLRGDFRIEAKWEGTTFTARRWSHDEPMGSARFVFTLIKDEDDEDEEE